MPEYFATIFVWWPPLNKGIQSHFRLRDVWSTARGLCFGLLRLFIGQHPHRLAGANRAAAQHTGVDAALAGVELFGDACDVAIAEGAGDGLAGRGIAGDLDKDGVTQAEPRAGNERGLRDAFERDVLARRAG